VVGLDRDWAYNLIARAGRVTVLSAGAGWMRGVAEKRSIARPLSASLLLMACFLRGAFADTLESALVQAYANNPQINSQRAIVRQTDEAVPQALAGHRPKVNAVVNGGEQNQSSTFRANPGFPPPIYQSLGGSFATIQGGVTATQTLVDGDQSVNRSRSAESQVRAARETLRLITQNVLLSAATVYLNLLRDSAIRDLQQRNVEVLGEQLRQTRERFKVQDVTRTDIDQADARLNAARAQLLVAESNYEGSRAEYRRIIGVDPRKLVPEPPVDRFSPGTLGAAVIQGMKEHPSVTAAMYGVDVAQFQVKVAEGALFPVLTLNGSLQKIYGPSLTTFESTQASLLAQMSVPIYAGGTEYSAIRQSKEGVGQKRLDLDAARDQIRSTVAQTWAQLQATKQSIIVIQAQVVAAERALDGVRQEARVGQRTTLDVLNAEAELVSGRVSVVSAQHDRILASYVLLAAVGRLSPEVLGLKIPAYDPGVHYHQIRDSWYGVRTPDGR
jgi:outer membrane protein